MRIPIRTPGGFNVDRRVTGGAAFRPNYSYRRYFGRRVSQRVYGMPFSGGSQRPRGVPNARRNLFPDERKTYPNLVNNPKICGAFQPKIAEVLCLKEALR